ncbi:hypothetical protein RRG08_014345 [Elysia crispata]|uniref:Uncharacterized protein n=1 Tax=Elysia crispata TaxID=231223 RepID=A0AAE0XNH3_9GAST|nr:hypothetical protein RRG08_014345 [Elysia crispata]
MELLSNRSVISEHYLIIFCQLLLVQSSDILQCLAQVLRNPGTCGCSSNSFHDQSKLDRRLEDSRYRSFMCVGGGVVGARDADLELGSPGGGSAVSGAG